MTEEKIGERERLALGVDPDEDVHHAVDALDRLDERTDRPVHVDDLVEPAKRPHRLGVVANALGGGVGEDLGHLAQAEDITDADPAVPFLILSLHLGRSPESEDVLLRLSRLLLGP